MIATLPYIEEKYREYNNMIFGGKLPEVQTFGEGLEIQLSRARTFMGAVTSKRKRNWFGRIEHYDYRLRISTRFDLPQDELDDIIIHEMIHYYIAVNKLKDTSAHGRIFRQMMADINTKYGRNITISHRLSQEEKNKHQDTTPRYHKVAIVTFSNGKTGVKILPKDESKQHYYLNTVGRSPKVSCITVIETTDPYFNRFPKSSALNAVYVDKEILEQHGLKITGG